MVQKINQRLGVFITLNWWWIILKILPAHILIKTAQITSFSTFPKKRETSEIKSVLKNGFCRAKQC